MAIGWIGLDRDRQIWKPPVAELIVRRPKQEMLNSEGSEWLTFLCRMFERIKRP